MTIEADLEAFRGLALERQIIIQSSQQDPDTICQEVTGDLDPLLESLVGDSNVLVTGSIFPICKKDDRISVDPDTKTDSAFGKSKGVLIAERSAVFPAEVSPAALVIGFLIDVSDDTKTKSYIFAPIEESSLLSPDLELSEVTAMPEDDEIADYIDACLLDEEINFTVLSAIFTAIGENPLQVDYYLRYITHILNLNAYTFEFTSDCLIQMTENPTYENVMATDTVFKTTCNPEKFVFIPEAGGLCFMFRTQEGYGEFIVPIGSLKSGHFVLK